MLGYLLVFCVLATLRLLLVLVMEIDYAGEYGDMIPRRQFNYYAKNVANVAVLFAALFLCLALSGDSNFRQKQLAAENKALKNVECQCTLVR
jgi:hypothetical protein